MILAQLGDLHLGYRAYGRLDQGRNARDRDVARAFERAIQELIRVEPAVVLLLGDVFDHPHPPPSALLALVRGIETLRLALPGTRVLAVGGRRDTPLSPADPGPVATLDAVPGVTAAAATARSVQVEEWGLHALLVPYRSAIEEPYPELRPDPAARWNILALSGTPGPRGPRIRASEWDYVALGGAHSHRELAPGVVRAGSLERVSPRPWEEAAEEKGFVTWDLEERRLGFHLVPGRPVVELAPTPVDPADPGSINARIREVVEGIPGGVEDKVVHLGIEGLGPEDHELLDARYLANVRRNALHLCVEIRPRGGPRRPAGAEDSSVPARVRSVLETSEDVEAGTVERALELAEEVLFPIEEERDATTTSREPDPLVFEGSDPLLGRVALEIPRGVVGLVVEDHRAREALMGLVARGMAGTRGGVERRVLLPDRDLAPETLLDAAERTAARIPAVEVVEAALSRLEGREPSGEEESGEAVPSVTDPEDALRRLAGRIRSLEGIPEEVGFLERELRELRATAVEVGGDLEFRTMEWLRERQDAETQLQAYRDRARELKARYREIESAGDESLCPTCGRPLGDHRDEVIAGLREEWEAVVQDGQWWKRRREQLEPKPEHLQELESRSLRLYAAIEELAERLERRRAELEDVDALRSEEADLRRRLHWEGEEDGKAPHPSHRQLLRRALGRVREELLAQGRERTLLGAARLVGRISGGRYTGLIESEGFVAFVEDGAPSRIVSSVDRAMARVSLRLAAAAEAGTPDEAGGPPIVLGSDLDELQEEEWVAALRALRSLTDRIPRIVVVTRREKLEWAPEALDAALELQPAEAGEGDAEARSLPVAPATVRLES